VCKDFNQAATKAFATVADQVAAWQGSSHSSTLQVLRRLAKMGDELGKAAYRASEGSVTLAATRATLVLAGIRSDRELLQALAVGRAGCL